MKAGRLATEVWRIVKVLLVLLLFSLLAAQPIPEDIPGYRLTEEVHEP